MILRVWFTHESRYIMTILVITRIAVVHPRSCSFPQGAGNQGKVSALVPAYEIFGFLCPEDGRKRTKVQDPVTPLLSCDPGWGVAPRC